MGLQDLVAGKAANSHDLLRQGLGHDIDLTVRGLHQGIALVGVEGNGQVPGDPEEAQIKFERYRCCTVHCMEQLRSGVSILRMIAA